MDLSIPSPAEMLKLDAVRSVLLLIVPGVVMVKVFDAMVPAERRDWAAQASEVLVYGVLSTLLFWWPLQWAAENANRCPGVATTAAVSALFILPATLSFAWCSLRIWNARLPFLHPYPTAWDQRFRQVDQGTWVVCHLKDGRIFGGHIGAKSFSSSFPHPRDLYIDQTWHMDQETGSFLHCAEPGRGMWVTADACHCIEFIDHEPPLTERVQEERAGDYQDGAGGAGSALGPRGKPGCATAISLASRESQPIATGPFLSGTKPHKSK